MRNLKNIALALIAMCGLSACVHNLNTTPIDPSVNTEVDRDALFNKVYGTFGMTGDGKSGDVDGIDEGTSAFYRMMFELNEFPADGGFWNWYNDAGVSEIYNLSWKSTNSLVAGLYYRLYFDITLCNHFIEKFGEDSDPDVQDMIYETRWVRAVNYYYLLDMFQDVPFADKVSAEHPKQMKRAELFAWLEKELLDLEDKMPAVKKNPYRADKYAATFMLMRLYLNAEVYTGTPKYTEAAAKAAEIMKSPYTLSPVYKEMFMADNDLALNPSACSEFVFSIYQDGKFCSMYGGSWFLVSGTRDSKLKPWGTADSWSCWRSSTTLFVGPWFTEEDAKNIKTLATTAGYACANEDVLPILAKDDRCMLSAYDTIGWDATNINKALDATKTGAVAGDNGGTFDFCWAICKWTNMRHDGTMSPNAATKMPDTDIPLLRASEAYLTYAEAVLRGGTACNGTAQDAIDQLRARAHATNPYTATLDNLLDEWQREFYSEGRRRTDLVRFGKFTSGDYIWEGKGNKALDDRYNVYPLPNADVVANKNLEQYLNY